MTKTAMFPRVVGAGQGPTYRVAAELVTFKAVAEDTGGAYSLFEARTPPRAGVPAHLQRYEDETFFVLEGTYTLLIDGERRELHAGDYAFVPRGTVHGFTNSGDAPALHLTLVTPGGIHEHFFAEVGELVVGPHDPPAPAGPPDLVWLAAVATKHGIEIEVPP